MRRGGSSRSLCGGRKPPSTTQSHGGPRIS